MRLLSLGIVLFVALVVLLPLYELADYSEHWPHDGNIAVPLLVLLALVGFAYICRSLVSLSLQLLKRALQVRLIPGSLRVEVRPCLARPPILFPILCDLRI